MLRPLHVALIFMTTLPVPQLKDWRDDDARRSVGAYPLIGLIVGLILLLAFELLAPTSALLRGALVTTLWLALTGALHFDGLCDMADAAFATKQPEERQIIAKDPHLGAFALAAGGTLLLVKAAVLAELENGWWLVVALILARSLVVLPMALFELSKGSSLGRVTRVSAREALLPLSLGLLLSIGIASWLDIPVYLASLLITTLLIFALAYWLVRRMAGLSGDAYGALIETSEAAVLICVSVFS